jgi:hypothetical protein
MQLGTKVIMQKHMAKEYTFWLKCKALCLGQINRSLSNCFLIFKHGGGCIMLWVFLTSENTGEFFRIKINWIGLSTGNILEENLLKFALLQRLGEEFTFQQDNNLRPKNKSTLKLLELKTSTVPK